MSDRSPKEPTWNIGAVITDLMSTLGWDDAAARDFAVRASKSYGGHPIAGAVATCLHDDFIDTTWPACPTHPNHPLTVHHEDSFSTWRCPSDGTVIANVGMLVARP